MIHFQPVGHRQLDRFDPLARGNRRERFGWHLVLQVVTTKDAANPVDGAAYLDAGVFAKTGQPSLVILLGAGLEDDLELFDGLLICDLVAVKPKQFTECSRITFVRFSFVGVFGLDKQDFVAAEVLEHLDQPFVEATDFDDRPETAVRFQASLRQSLKELGNFFRFGTDLSPEDNVAVLISQVDSQLLCMLVDSKVK